jgi:peptidoglycan/xylan/chitin deacetylase (PgdA/CDA1 family)
MLRRVFLASLFATAWAFAQEPAAPATPSPALAPSPVPDDSTRVAVLGYHDFSEAQPETQMRMKPSKFRKQMETIRQLGITVISLEDFLAWKRGEKTLPERCVLITLDDGWKSVYTDAYPVLKEFGFPFALYLYKNYVDIGGKSLSSDMIREMMQHGAGIGSHSVSHPFPGVVKGEKKKGADSFDAFLRNQIGESKRFLEGKFPYPITTYAYPGGYHCEEMYPLATEFGYHVMFTVVAGKVRRSTPNLVVPRYMVLGNNEKPFEMAVSFRDGASAPVVGAGASTPQKTLYPVSPEAGTIIQHRLPKISADLSTLTDYDPASLVMKVSGFGEVPATFDPATKQLSWQVNRKLRQPSCQVSISWKTTPQNKLAEVPLRWSFRVDLANSYLPEGTEPAHEADVPPTAATPVAPAEPAAPATPTLPTVIPAETPATTTPAPTAAPVLNPAPAPAPAPANP